eukprot:355138-Chlamydomonas_euryale.AAC.3
MFERRSRSLPHRSPHSHTPEETSTTLLMSANNPQLDRSEPTAPAVCGELPSASALPYLHTWAVRETQHPHGRTRCSISMRLSSRSGGGGAAAAAPLAHNMAGS